MAIPKMLRLATLSLTVGLATGASAQTSPELLALITDPAPEQIAGQIPELRAEYIALQRKMGMDHPATHRAQARLTVAEARQSDAPLTLMPRYAQSVDRLISAVGPFAETPAYLRFDLSMHYAQRGLGGPAKRLVHQALLATTKQPSPRAAALSRMYAHLATVLLEEGNYSEARRALELATKAADRCIETDRQLCVDLTTERGAFAVALGDLAAAEGHYLESLSALEALPADDPRRRRPLDLLGRLWMRQGSVERAEALLLEREGLFNAERGRRRSAHPALADARRLRGDLTGALEIYDRAIAELTATHGWGTPMLVEAYSGKALAHVGLKQSTQARHAAFIALAIAELRNQPALQWQARAAVAQVLSAESQSTGAILFGKLALQRAWKASETVRPLGPDAQHTFLRGKEPLYTSLINDLSAAELWGEAQGLSGTWNAVQEGQALSPPPPLSPDEQAFQRRYHTHLQQLAQRCLAADPPGPEARPWRWQHTPAQSLTEARTALQTFAAQMRQELQTLAQ
ncbi:MAG: tetratricopeptide repeat protein [Bradymonadia bacterium]